MMILVLETLNRKRHRIHNIPWPSNAPRRHALVITPCCSNLEGMLAIHKDSSGRWCHQVLPCGQISCHFYWPNFWKANKKVHSTWKDGHLGTCVIHTPRTRARVLYQIYKCGEKKLLWLWPCQLQTRPWIIKSIKSLGPHQINEAINTNKCHKDPKRSIKIVQSLASHLKKPSGCYESKPRYPVVL